jgi:hypothetical protein
MSLIRIKQIESGELFSFVESVFSGELGTLSSDVDYLLTYTSGISGYVDNISGKLDILSGDVVDLTNLMTGFDARLELISGRVNDLEISYTALSGYVDTVSGIATAFSGLAQDAYDLSQETLDALFNTGGIIDIISGRVDILSGNLITVSGMIDSFSGAYTGYTGSMGVTGPQILGRQAGFGQATGVSMGSEFQISGGALVTRSYFPVSDVLYMSSVTGSATTTVPIDNTIPQIGEGDEIWSQNYTPVLQNSNIIVEFDYTLSASAAANVTTSLFVTGGADAVAAKLQNITASGSMEHCTIRYNYTNTTTGVKDFSVRCGPGAAGTVFFNMRGPATPLYSTAALMTFRFTETRP